MCPSGAASPAAVGSAATGVEVCPCVCANSEERQVAATKTTCPHGLPSARGRAWTFVHVDPTILIAVTSRVAGDLHFFFVCTPMCSHVLLWLLLKKKKKHAFIKTIRFCEKEVRSQSLRRSVRSGQPPPPRVVLPCLSLGGPRGPHPRNSSPYLSPQGRKALQ